MFGVIAVLLIGFSIAGLHRPANSVKPQVVSVPAVRPAAPVKPATPSTPAPFVLARPESPRARNNINLHEDNRGLNPPMLDTNSPPTTSQQPASAEPSSPYQAALIAASEAEQDNIQGAWSGGSPEQPQTEDIQATVGSSAALTTMVTAMDEMAQSQSDSDHLSELRGRFNAIMGKAYGGSGIDPSLPATRSFLQAHPGLPQVP